MGSGCSVRCRFSSKAWRSRQALGKISLTHSSLAVNAQEDQQTSLVAALRDKIVHTVQSARDPATAPARAQLKLHNANMFLNGLVSTDQKSSPAHMLISFLGSGRIHDPVIDDRLPHTVHHHDERINRCISEYLVPSTTSGPAPAVEGRFVAGV